MRELTIQGRTILSRNFLVTGGAGFIGGHLVRQLLLGGHHVTVVDDMSSPTADAGIASHVQDFRRGSAGVAGVEVINERQLDGVFHLAALISGQESFADPEAYVAANVQETAALAAAVREHQPEGCRFVLASSSTIYGDAGGEACSLTLAPSPVTPYAATKVAAEGLVASLCPNSVNLRLFNVYGPGQSHLHPYANVLAKWCRAVSVGDPIVLYGDGNQDRDFVHVADVVRALILGMTTVEPGTYNVGTGSSHSLAEVIEWLRRIYGGPVTVQNMGAWTSDVRTVRADHEGLMPGGTIELREGLQETLAWFMDEVGAA